MLPDDDPQLDLHFLAVRQGVGLLGLFLPTALFVYCQSAAGRMQPSISEFYYTAMGDIFVGALFAIGIFLISYKGYRKRPARFRVGDLETSLVAGLSAIGVALLPAGADPAFALCVDTLGAQGPCGAEPATTLLTGLHFITGPLHFMFAGLFFLALAYFCLMLFPLGGKRNAQGGPALSVEHVIYLICGIVLLASIGANGLYAVLPDGAKAALRSVNFVFWAESAGVYAFAIAWLTKGDALTRPLGFRLTGRTA